MQEAEAAADLAVLVAAAENAGALAMGYFKKDPETWTKGDDSPVTEADLAVNALLHADLLAARPDYGWLSEESEDNAERLSTPRVFVVDPIDGTRAFVAGQSAWGHAIAVVEAGVVQAGVVFMPVTGKLYAAHRGGRATLGGVEISARDREAASGADVLMNKAALKSSRWRGSPPAITPHFRPSLAYRFCLVAEGRFDACVTLRSAWEWDTAAGTLIAEAAGARVSDANGTPLTYNQPDARHKGLLMAGPKLHAAFLSLLSDPV